MREKFIRSSKRSKPTDLDAKEAASFSPFLLTEVRYRERTKLNSI
jgi:hypothetical protein